MKCPKCSHEIDENAVVCPHCKKVLKLVCPICKTVNKSNICIKCGYTIVTKCSKCGKINQTINGKCKNCGFSTDSSVLINESQTDDFASLSLSFPNLNAIKDTLVSPQTYKKFLARLNGMIYECAQKEKVRRQVVREDEIIIFLNKDLTFTTSCKHSVDLAISILNDITALNKKLEKHSSIQLRCDAAILKRSSRAKNDEYESGVNVKIIYDNEPELKVFNNIQLLTDQYVYDVICKDFELNPLSSIFIQNQMRMFYEFNTQKYITVAEDLPEEKPPEIPDVPDFVEEDEEPALNEKEKLYDIEAINFDEIKCNFEQIESADKYDAIVNQFRKSPKSIVSLKSIKPLEPITFKLISKIESVHLFKTIYRITCTEEMKYKPYGFFYELISNIYNFSVASVAFPQNNFDMFKQVDPSDFIKDLISMNIREFPHPEDTRYSLFDIFLTIIYSMENALIYIENADYIDDTSKEVFNTLLQKFEEMDVSYLVQSSKDFSLHKDAHFLLAKPYYSEMNIKPSKFPYMIAKDNNPFNGIVSSFYFKKMAQNTKGSELYLQNATDYLIENGIIGKKNGMLVVLKQESLILPNSLDELIQRRLKFLSRYKDAFQIFIYLLLSGPRVDFLTLHSFGIQTAVEAVKKLEAQGLLYIYDNAIYIQNFNLYRENLLLILSPEAKQVFMNDLLTSTFSNPDIALPIRALFFKTLKMEKAEFLEWEKLSQINTSLGDFSAFLNCSIKFLNLLDNNVDENSEKTISEYKLDVYENISNLLYKYTPDKIYNIAQIILDNLEQSTDDKKVIDLCNKMLQGCLISGNYTHALQLTHKILSRMPNSSLSPSDATFNLSYFLINVVKVEVLFNIGDFEDCIELGKEIFTAIPDNNFEQLLPTGLTETQFLELIYDTLGFVLIAYAVQLKDMTEIINIIVPKLGTIPQYFEYFGYIPKLLRGVDITIDDKGLEEQNKYAKFIISMAIAFTQNSQDYNLFAGTIYQAKLNAKMNNLHQLELLCDLLIGYSYFKLGRTPKAVAIYKNVLAVSSENGLKNIIYITWFLSAIVALEENNIEVATGIIMNATINLEKSQNASDFIIMIFKYLQTKLLIQKGDIEQAQHCLNYANYIQNKYGLTVFSDIIVVAPDAEPSEEADSDSEVIPDEENTEVNNNSEG